jgi:hypothetical protein
MKPLQILSVALLLLLCALSAQAAPVRVYVADMNAIGVQNRDEMKATLQMLLSSRLNGDKITAVASAGEADAIVTGTYVVIGKVFSVDALAKTTAGKTLTRAFVQGDNQDELIAAVGKLADKLTIELDKVVAAGQLTASASPALPATVRSAAVPPKSDIIKAESQVRAAPVGEFIKPAEYEKGGAGGWISKRLNISANLMAIGRNLPDGSREVVLAEDRRFAYYRQGAEMKFMSDVELRPSEKIVSVDTMVGAGGELDIYVSIVRSYELSSQIWQVKGDTLVQVADDLPYYFRSFNLAGGPKKVYAQGMGRDADFFGDVFEVSRVGKKIELKNPIKMPRYGDIYTFNQFRDQDGNLMTVVINPDNYLIAYDKELNELWRSNDKFGGSELFFQKDDAKIIGEKFRSIFLNQKVQVTSKNEVLVGKNDGFWVIGDARSYKKGAVYCMAWNGSSLEEKWHTRDTQNYMPDYSYDEARNELLILQLVQRPGLLGKQGAASLSIKKVE